MTLVWLIQVGFLELEWLMLDIFLAIQNKYSYISYSCSLNITNSKFNIVTELKLPVIISMCLEYLAMKMLFRKMDRSLGNFFRYTLELAQFLYLLQ